MAAPHGRGATVAYTAPFLLYVGMFLLPLEPRTLQTLRFFLVLAAVLAFSLPYLRGKPAHPTLAIGTGLGVFFVWIGPDLLFHYRHHWLFENPLFGKLANLPDPLRRDLWFLLVRILTTAFLVPVVEEVFWRGWLWRWLMHKDFQKVSLGNYDFRAFWLVAVLFASEHGPYWEVGLAAGIVYNWLLLRTRNLADCILAHAVTNGALAIWVLAAGQWQYWP